MLLRSLAESDHADVAMLLHQRGRAFFFLERLEEAEAAYREALAMRIRLLGDVHQDVASTTGHLAATLRKQGRWAEADPLYRRAMELNQTIWGENSKQLAEATNNYAYFLLKQGDHVGALREFETALSIAEEAGAEDVHLAAIQNNIATCLLAVGDLDRAEEEINKALEVKLAAFNETNRSVLVARHLRACLLEARGQLNEAVKECGQVLDARRRMYPNGGPEVDESETMYARLTAAVSGDR
jgi:tetratricopeptide (TPR) repeat protein